MSAPASEARVVTSESNPSAAVWEWQFFRGPAWQGLFFWAEHHHQKKNCRLTIGKKLSVVSFQFSVLDPKDPSVG
jgi:hypothetical protein